MPGLLVLILLMGAPVVTNGQEPGGSVNCVQGAIHSLLSENSRLALNKVVTIDQVERQLWAVHATNVYAADSLRLRANQLSPTFHFSIGQLVPSHANGNWENAKFALLVPMRELYPQIVNLMGFDTFVLGDLKIPKSAIWIGPKGALGSAIPRRFIEYDPEITTLRVAIEDAITKNRGLVLSTGRDLNGNLGDMTDFLSFKDLTKDAPYSWMQSGPNLNTLEFFGPLFSKRPGLSFGRHNLSAVGEAGRFGQIDYFLQRFANGGRSSLRDAFSLAIARTNLAKSKQAYSDWPLTHATRRSLEQYYVRMERKLNATGRKVRADTRGSRFERKNVWDLFYDQSFNLEILTLHKGDLPGVLAEVERLQPGVTSQLGELPFFDLQWVTRRFIQLKKLGAAGEQLIKKEQLLPAIREAYQRTSSAQGEGALVRSVLTQEYPSLFRGLSQ